MLTSVISDAFMASAGELLSNAVTELSMCLGRPPSLPRNPAGFAELLRAVVLWASTGPESTSEQHVAKRMVCASRAALRLLQAVHTASRDGLALDCSAGAVPRPAKCAAGKPPREQTGVFSCSITEGAPPREQTGGVFSCSITEGAPPRAASSSSWPASGRKTIDPQCVLSCAAAPLLLLCGAHTQDMPWTDPESRSMSKKLLDSLLQVANCESVAELLRGPKNQHQEFGTYREALGLLGPRLQKDTWESCPDAKIVFSWMLFQVPRPWLTEFLDRVMPPSLLFSDHYTWEDKALGISCLHHIIKNVPAADLQQYNYAVVVYHALRNHLYTTHAEIIQAVLPCLLDLFPVLQKPAPHIGEYRKEGDNPLDEVMQLVLTHMEMEHRIALRRVYARNLVGLQNMLGVRVARHMKRLLRVIIGYMEMYDGPEETARLYILETLKGTIRYAWPRIPRSLPLLTKALLRLIYDLSSQCHPNPESVTDALLLGASDCLLLLDQCSKGQVKAALEGIPSICNQPRLLQCIKRLQQDV